MTGQQQRMWIEASLKEARMALDKIEAEINAPHLLLDGRPLPDSKLISEQEDRACSAIRSACRGAGFLTLDIERETDEYAASKWRMERNGS